jgi:alpha-L-fucosidase
MKTIWAGYLLLIVAAVSLCTTGCAVKSAGNPSSIANVDPYADETPAQRDARMEWWRDARFGMFIHWGVYSVPAGTYQGKQIGGIGEWIMNRGKIPCTEYQKYAAEFNPIKYDADEWVRLAKEAGMKYIVITSKHHDGFAMFNSKASDWNIVKATPYKHDPLKDLAAACKKHGVKLGFYYSQAQDWNHPGGSASGGHWDKAQDGSMDDYIRKVAVPQVREILTNYGPIAVLWWDTPTGMNKERAEMLLPLLKLQPGIIHNNRLGGGYSGDIETPEQYIPPTGIPGKDWEVCMTINGTWGYKSYDNNWKSTESLVRNLVDIASKGGNYLLNVGPTSEGLIPEPSIERLKEMGAWMKVNGQAIYGTTASPFKRLAWGRCTKKVTADGATLYLHVFDWPKDGKLIVPGLKNAVFSAELLADGSRLESISGPDGVTISVPVAAPDKMSSTIVVKVKGALDVELPVLGQAADGSLTLPADEAVCHGKKTKYQMGNRHEGYIAMGDNPGDWVEWNFKITSPGAFTVIIEQSSMGQGSFEVSVGSRKLTGKAVKTGDNKKYEKITVGTIELLEFGKANLSVRPVKEGWQPINFKNITLKPAPATGAI